MGRCVQSGSIRQGSWYWVRDRNNQSKGLVVMMAWMFSSKRYHMPYVHLYNECGWECLVCQPHYLNLWIPSRAIALAVRILDELAEELKRGRRPVTFASFSGGTKACSYMIIQILEGKCTDIDMEKYKIVRECTVGHMFDSTPISFEKQLGVRFLQRMLGNSVGGNLAVKYGLHAVANTLQALFNSDFEAQALVLRSSFFAAAEMAPVLLLCSRNDRLAPFEEIEKFYSEVREQHFNKVRFVHWEESDHVAHLRYHPEEYKQAVSNFLSEVSGAQNLLRDSNPKQSQRSGELQNASTVKLKDVADMIVEDVYDLQHDFKDDFTQKKIILTFPPMRSRL